MPNNLSPGTIIKIQFNPQAGHEQQGYRPALVVSSAAFNKLCNVTWVVPISNTTNTRFAFIRHLPNGLKTTGSVLVQHLKAFDVNARGYTVVESVPIGFLEEIIELITLAIK